MKDLKRIILIIVILSFMTVTACGSNDLDETYKNESLESQNSFQASSIFKESSIMVSANNTLPPDQLITKSYDIHYIIEKYFSNLNLVGTGTTLTDIVNDFGVECLRETDKKAIYSVHKIKQGGFLYIFYANFTQTEDYRGIIRWFYVQNSLSYSDFSVINEGSTIDKVKAIDPTTQIFINIYKSNSEYWDESGGFGSWHYLSDGILEITYQNKNGKLTITQLHFIEDFQITQWTAKSYPYDGHILPIDKIK